VGQLIYDLGNKQWDIPKLRELLETILPNNMSFDNFEVEHVFPQIGKRTMLLNARRIPPPPEKMKTILLAIEDITERKQAEEALRENEEKYRNLVESISDVIYEIDSQGVIVYVSPIVKDVMGYDPADVIGKNFIEFVYKDDRSLLMVLLSDLRTGRTTPSEYRLTDKSGDLRWVRTRTRPIMEDGRFTGARGTIIDITERKNAEEEKHRIEERSRKVVEDIFRFIPEGVLVFSRKIELLRQNKAFREIVSGYAQRLGFAEDELENLIIDKVKAGLRDNNIKEIRIARKHEAGK
jgi:PAS domain S-box-containing protein